MLMMGIEQRRIQHWTGAKVQESRLSLTKVRKVKKVQYHHPYSSSWSSGGVFEGCLNSAKQLVFTPETEQGVFAKDLLSSLLSLLLLLWPDDNLFVVPLRSLLLKKKKKSLITETCSRASVVVRIRSQNGLVKNGISYVKKATPGSLSPVLYPSGPQPFWHQGSVS